MYPFLLKRKCVEGKKEILWLNCKRFTNVFFFSLPSSGRRDRRFSSMVDRAECAGEDWHCKNICAFMKEGRLPKRIDIISH